MTTYENLELFKKDYKNEECIKAFTKLNLKGYKILLNKCNPHYAMWFYVEIKGIAYYVQADYYGGINVTLEYKSIDAGKHGSGCGLFEEAVTASVFDKDLPINWVRGTQAITLDAVMERPLFNIEDYILINFIGGKNE